MCFYWDLPLGLKLMGIQHSRPSFWHKEYFDLWATITCLFSGIRLSLCGCACLPNRAERCGRQKSIDGFGIGGIRVEGHRKLFRLSVASQATRSLWHFMNFALTFCLCFFLHSNSNNDWGRDFWQQEYMFHIELQG